MNYSLGSLHKGQAVLAGAAGSGSASSGPLSQKAATSPPGDHSAYTRGRRDTRSSISPLSPGESKPGNGGLAGTFPNGSRTRRQSVGSDCLGLPPLPMLYPTRGSRVRVCTTVRLNREWWAKAYCIANFSLGGRLVIFEAATVGSRLSTGNS